LLSELLSGPLAWIGGAVILAILGYFGLRRRQPAAPAAGPAAAGATTAPATHSAFGTAGGQSVDTSSSSIQTDFSQAGLGAIDTEEGVDPVAEADVYMAYGRDAQAEEILLDALKNEPTRHAIHVKLLEIYAQRKDVRQFDARASDLYAQTGGVGPEWEKAATMGRKLDPSNPMFGAPGRAEPVEETRFTEKTIVVSSPDKLRDTWTMPGELGQIASAVEGGIQDRTVVLEAPLVESGATAVAEAGKGEIDFDLGLDFSTTLNKPKPAGSLVESTYAMEPGSARKGAVDLPVEESVETGAPTENLIDFDLGKQPGARAPEDQSGTIDLESTDISGNVVDFALEETRVPASPSARVVDLEHTDIGGNLMHFEKAVRETPAASPVVDLEKTDFGGEVLDFNFQLEGTEGKPGGKETPPAARAPDLTGISLDLAAQGPEGQPSAGGENPDVVTKLELAKAYEEMGDKEGARELLDEVLKEGSDAQKERAREMLGRLG
jgi:pilus assembly protein FimV